MDAALSAVRNSGKLDKLQKTITHWRILPPQWSWSEYGGQATDQLTC